VVLPTCHREQMLARCLESLRPSFQSADPESYEVIVTDDAQDSTAEAMIGAKFPWARWVKGPSRGPAANRNHGATYAKGEWLCFIDDDCIASPGWIAALRGAASDESVDLLEGRTTVPDLYDSAFIHFIANENGGVFWSCNLAVRRERFLALGGFDEDFLDPASEDMEFAHRFHAHHFRSKFFPEALVYHPTRRVRWRSIFKRHFSIRWAAMYRYKVDEGLHLTDSSTKNVLRALKDTLMSHIRTTWHDLRDWKRPYWRNRNFWLGVRWVMFPVYLPYYLYWVHRFHGELNAKRQTSVRPSIAS
jgi:GT2 family glycosyltransferase